MGVWAKRKEKAKWTIYSTKKPLWNTDTSGVKFGQGLMEKMGWSVGKGLGVNEQGIQEPLRVSYKNDTKGIGFKENDNWSEHQDEFNSLLMELRNSDDSHVIKIPEGEKNEFKSLEEKSKQSRTRVHYQKFTRGKDLSRYSENDLACIIGTSKKKEKSKNELTVSDNFETSFGVTTINSGSIQDYFKKKWITNQKPSNSACGATETAVEHYAIEKACFSIGEEKLEENENLENDQNRFSEKHKSNSNLDLLKTNDSFKIDNLEKSKRNDKKRKKKETQDVDSEEETNIKKMKKNYASNNIHVGEFLQENKTLLTEVLDKKKKKETMPLENENENDSKDHFKSEILADEENLKYFKIKKRKKNTENYDLQDVNSSNNVSQTNQKENSPDMKLFKKKKKKEKREKQKENEEIENQDYSVISDMPSNDYNKNSSLSIDRINDPNERENTLEIDFNTKKKKKKKKEKSKEIDEILTVHSGDENSGKATEFCIEISSVKKKKRKKEKHREKEKIRDPSNNLSAHSNDDDKTNTESTLEIESVKKRKKKKEEGKKNFNENKDILKVSQNEEFCSKDECTEKANATNDMESVSELITSKKKKRKNQNEELLENEELPSNFNYEENRETQGEGEKINVATAISEVGSVKKKKKKKDKKEKNFNENLTENEIIKSCNHKDSEEKNKFENSHIEISETHSSSNYNSNNNAVNINNSDNINTSNGKIRGKNNDEGADVLNAKAEEIGMHKHKLELLSEKTIDKFYPGYDTNARVQKLIRWTNIAKFKGSNLGDVSGYGYSKKFQAKESR